MAECRPVGGAAGIRHLSGNRTLQCIQRLCAAAAPAVGQVAAAGGVIACLIKLVIHVIRLGRLVAEFIVCRQQDSAMLCGIVFLFRCLDSRKACQIADIIQIALTALNELCIELARCIRRGDRWLLVKTRLCRCNRLIFRLYFRDGRLGNRKVSALHLGIRCPCVYRHRAQHDGQRQHQRTNRLASVFHKKPLLFIV